MKQHATSTFLVGLFVMIGVTASAQESYIVEQIFSPTFGSARLAWICLPGDYDPDRATPYGVIFHLHGGGGGHNSSHSEQSDCSWGFDKSGYEDLVIVNLDGDVDVTIHDWNISTVVWGDSPLFGPIEGYVLDMVAHVDSTYNVGGADKRAIIGGSSGSLGAVRTGFRNYDTFAAVMTQHGFPEAGTMLDTQSPGAFVDIVLGEQGGGPPYTYQPFSYGTASHYMFLLAAILSPNSANTPYLVDLPFDENGEVVDSIRTKWISENPISYLADIPEAEVPAIWVEYMVGDQVNADGVSIAFRDSLDAMGITYRYLESPSGHGGIPEPDWVKTEKWNWLANVLGLGPRTDAEPIPAGSESLILGGSYPNPFIESTEFEVSAESAWTLQVSVIDILGREVNGIDSDLQIAEAGRVVWRPADDISPGVYFFVVQDRERTEYLAVVKVR